MDIGMAAKGDVESLREEGDQRIVDPHSGLRRNRQRNMEFWKGSEWEGGKRGKGVGKNP